MAVIAALSHIDLDLDFFPLRTSVCSHRYRWGTWRCPCHRPSQHSAAMCSHLGPAAGGLPPAGGAPSAAERRKRTVREQSCPEKWSHQWFIWIIGGGWVCYCLVNITKAQSTPTLLRFLSLTQLISSSSEETKQDRKADVKLHWNILGCSRFWVAAKETPQVKA